jgi:hypothetical protein
VHALGCAARTSLRRSWSRDVDTVNTAARIQEFDG